MNNIQYLELLVTEAKRYRKTALDALLRDTHMHAAQNIPGRLTQADVDAVLVGFINSCGAKRGVDFALYSGDLVEVSPKEAG